MLIQFLWIRQAYITESRTFDHNVHLALRNVVESLCQSDGLDVPAYNPIEQLSGNYFVVRTSQALQPKTLEYFLSAELAKRNISADFEYGIYDCQSQRMVYGDVVSTNPGYVSKASFPSLREDQYYFGVLFPFRQRYLLGRIDFLMYSSGGLLLVIGFFVYAMVTMTRQKRLSEIQRDFINNMTHEFKTPLSTIKLSAEVILAAGKNEDPERLAKYATLIEREADRLQYHVEEVLQVAAIEKRRLGLHLRAQHLAPLLEDFASTAHRILGEANGELVIKNKCPQVMVKVDALHFQNVLSNLLDNSIKYSDKPPRVSVMAGIQKNWVVISFGDNGRGIAAGDLKHIFDKFFRVSTGDVQSVPGFGLGLFYVRQTLKAHGGSVSATSQPGEGTVFHLKIPLLK